MTKNRIALVSCAGFGAAGAALRGLSAAREFDASTGALARSAPVFWVLAGLFALFAAGLAVFLRQKPASGAQRRPLPLAWLIVEFAAIAALFVCAVTDATRQPFSAPMLIRAVFAAFAALALVAVARSAARGGPERAYGLLLTIPVFFSAFNLVLFFWSRAGNPSLGEFVYTLLAFVFMALSQYYACSVFFTGKCFRRAVLSSGFAVALGLTALFGPLLAGVFAAGAPLARAGRLLPQDAPLLAFTALRGAALLFMLDSGALRPAPEPAEPEENPEDIALQNDEN